MPPFPQELGPHERGSPSGQGLRFHRIFVRLRQVLTLPFAVLVAGCAALSQSVISVDGASLEHPDSTARITIDTEKPVLLRAVDGKPLPGSRVSSRLRSYAYVLRPGTHVLWVSSAPYGLPLVPQRIGCYVIDAEFPAGSSYSLRFDAVRQAPVLTHSAGAAPEVAGVLVDEPLVLERGCNWR